jgi:hypothetical protein
MFNFFFENRVVYEIMWKNMTEPESTQIQSSTARSHFMLDNYDHKHALRICNNYCFSTTTVIARTRLNLVSSLRFLL